ncbi:uncharacterized protein LOC135094753 isoform X2 [Scylla paramamosain]|uniref:uncharacterized protein LOC135094753 isoform X2 n=1 Tax=Scylla paramamosain TaxID=85552 RepID=UPI003083A681
MSLVMAQAASGGEAAHRIHPLSGISAGVLVSSASASTNTGCFNTCEYKAKNMVSWIRKRDYQLLTVSLYTHSSDDRFSINYVHWD